jgi:hypothetical protein
MAGDVLEVAAMFTTGCRIKRTMPRFLFAAFLLVTPVSGAHAESQLIAKLDTNKDGALDLDETQAGASAAFEKLLRTLPSEFSSQERQDRLRRKFLAAVKRWFKAADIDGNGKLDESELEGPGGLKVEMLLSK